MSHVGVSSDGTALMIFTFPRKSDSDTGASSGSTSWNSGALSPALISGPNSVIGFPLNVTTPFRSCMARLLADNESRIFYTCTIRSLLSPAMINNMVR